MISYQLDEIDRQHLSNLLWWLKREVGSAGGDGDGVWLSKNYSVEHLEPLVREIFADWNMSNDGKTIHLSHPPEESFWITNDPNFDMLSVDWIQVKLMY